MKCLNCFNVCLDGAKFCNVCGAPLQTATTPLQPEMKIPPIPTASKVSPPDLPLSSPPPIKPQYESSTKSQPAYVQPQPVKPQSAYAQPQPVKPQSAYAQPQPVKPQSAYAQPQPVKPQSAYAKQERISNPSRKDEPAYDPSRIYEKESVRAGVKALTTGRFIVMEILLYIPIINIILMCLWSFGNTDNPNRRNYARAKLICIPIIIALAILIAVVFYFTGILDSLIAMLQNYIK